MIHFSPFTIERGSHVTLHYRLSFPEGADIINTFGHRPATLLLGAGQLAPCLEDILLGMKAGDHSAIQLTPEQAFGIRQAERIVKVSRATLDAHGVDTHALAPGDRVEFNAPNSRRCAGMFQKYEKDGVVFDFNHPLAGQTLMFEVRVIAVL